MNRLYLIAIVCLIFVSAADAQIDTEFWFAPPEVTFGHGDRPLLLRMSSVDDAAIVTVTMPARKLQLGVYNIPAATTQTVILSDLLSDLETNMPNVVMNTGIKITSTTPITVYYEEASFFNNEIFVLKGKNGLGNNFMLPWQDEYNNATDYLPLPYASFDIVATEDNTVVTVIPSKPVEGHEGEKTITVKLNAGETYSFKKPGNLAANNFVGTVVNSTKPIAITLKDDSVMKNGGCRDLLGDQLIPIKVTGKEYIVPRGFLNKPEFLFIMAIEDNTDIFVSGVSVPVAHLNAGQLHRVEITLPAIYVVGSKKIYVLHVTGFGCEVGMAVLPPINCTGSKRVSFTRSNAEFFGMNILAKKDALQYFKLTSGGKDVNVPASKFTLVPGSGGEWYTAQIEYDVSDVAVGQGSVLTNSQSSFQAGIINGNAGTSCRYGYFSSFSVLFIGDDRAICQGDSLLIDAGSGKETYLWSTGATTQSIQVKDPGSYWVTTTRENCTLTDTLRLAVRTGKEDLGPDIFLCAGDSAKIDGKSNFSWLWRDGSTDQFLKTDQLGKYWISVIDNFGCPASDTVMVDRYNSVFNPLTELMLNAVSVDTTVEKNIDVSWKIARPDLLPGNITSLFRREDDATDWQFVGAFQDTTNRFKDPDLPTLDHTFSYYLNLSDQCKKEYITTPIHTSILLTGIADTVTDYIDLRWNKYINWKVGVDHYELWRKLDLGKGYRFVGSINNLDDSFSDQIGGAGFKHQYAIRAVEHDGANESWSNPIRFNFNHPITVPNVFTPNGDNYNQFFEIPNIELYTSSELIVVDRWGEEVYHARSYKNDWSGQGLSTGVYYYVLKLNKDGQVVKGVVTILK
ncbi:MAG: gliding motility-associated C-terminal domain-containing protein [Chryseolinea sp.]